MNEGEFAELVRRRRDLAKFFRYIKPGGHIRKGYYRRKAKDEKNRLARHPSKLRTQVAFGEAAHGAYGERGLPEGLPVAASAVREEMRGEKYRKPRWQKAIEELTKAMKEAVEAAKEI